jgi:NAD(P) transhydrogenase subunit alpha
MPIRIAVPKETTPGERRVACVPDVVARLTKLGAEVLVEKGAGSGAFIPDGDFVGARVVESPEALYAEADVVLTVQPPDERAIDLLREGAVVVGFMAPYRYPERVARMRDRKITSLAMELVPRISRAQSIDALSSQAAAAGYEAVLMAARLTGRFLPMLTTAAGTIRPARVLVIGAGVAGLQAIATAKRLGAMVEAYDVRPATKQEVQSLGAKFVELDVKAEGAGGYARELTDEEKQKQQELLAQHIGAADVVLSTAAVPGRPAPRIITAAMVERMKPGAVIVDLAAEFGGNCELTRPGEQLVHNGVTVYGPLNVPSMLCVHASELYARNLYNLLLLMIKDGSFAPDWEDEVLRGCTLTRDGQIRHEPTRQMVEGAST